jgi:hypothetical protein
MKWSGALNGMVVMERKGGILCLWLYGAVDREVAPTRCAVRPNAEPPYRSDPTFPKVSIPPGPAEASKFDRASAREEMGVRGG